MYLSDSMLSLKHGRTWSINRGSGNHCTNYPRDQGDIKVIALDDVNRSEISRQTGVDMAHISRIFNRRSKPSLHLALSISHTLGVTVEELCDSLGIGLTPVCSST